MRQDRNPNAQEAEAARQREETAEAAIRMKEEAISGKISELYRPAVAWRTLGGAIYGTARGAVEGFVGAFANLTFLRNNYEHLPRRMLNAVEPVAKTNVYSRILETAYQGTRVLSKAATWAAVNCFMVYELSHGIFQKMATGNYNAATIPELIAAGLILSNVADTVIEVGRNIRRSESIARGGSAALEARIQNASREPVPPVKFKDN